MLTLWPSGLVATEHVVVPLIRVVFRPARAGLIHQTKFTINHVGTCVAVRNCVASDPATSNWLAVIEAHLRLNTIDQTEVHRDQSGNAQQKHAHDA